MDEHKLMKFHLFVRENIKRIGGVVRSVIRSDLLRLTASDRSEYFQGKFSLAAKDEWRTRDNRMPLKFHSATDNGDGY